MDPCLAGTWIATLQQGTNRTNGEPVQFTGDTGLTEVIKADGAVHEVWSDSVRTADVGGTEWEEIINGTATLDIKTEGAQLFVSKVSPGLTYTMRVNGPTATVGIWGWSPDQQPTRARVTHSGRSTPTA
jgi:hypothetical protein